PPHPPVLPRRVPWTDRGVCRPTGSRRGLRRVFCRRSSRLDPTVNGAQQRGETGIRGREAHRKLAKGGHLRQVRVGSTKRSTVGFGSARAGHLCSRRMPATLHTVTTMSS